MNTEENNEKTFIQEIISPAKHLWQYLLAIFILSALFLPLVWRGQWTDPLQLFRALTWTFSIWLTQIAGHTLIFHFLDKILSWKDQPVLRAFAGIFSMIVYASLAFIGVQILMQLIFFQEWPDSTFGEMIDDSMFAIKIAAGFSFVATLIGFFSAWRKSEIEKEKLNTQMMVHKYNALQNQINPHFLFNSFNVLSELVYENQDLAVKFIQQMSDLYRYVLSVKNEDLISLSDEVEFAKSFAFLLKTRFEDKLEIHIEVAASPQEQIVPMCLQLLIENAVKHNEASSTNPLKIEVYKEGQHIVVKNSKRFKKPADHSTGTGLANIKERYKHLGIQNIDIIQNDAFFMVSVPIIEVE